MEQFDKWHGYWDNYLQNKYGKGEVSSEDDLYLQVARTVQKKPIPKEVFSEIITNITSDLHLSANDILVDFCCGNGLFTYELKDNVQQIIGVDFSQNIIDTANKYRAAANISYHVGSAIDWLKDIKDKIPGVVPNKYLMNDSLAYFSPADLKEMLIHIIATSPHFVFLLRGVPNDRLKWNYYNTEERKAVYLANIAKGDHTNDGLGSWWVPGDISAICSALGLKCVIRDQQLPLSDYRMDVMISNH